MDLRSYHMVAVAKFISTNKQTKGSLRAVPSPASKVEKWETLLKSQETV